MTTSELQNLTWVKGQPVRARLLDAQLWSEFLAINNEMIVTKTGRLVLYQYASTICLCKIYPL